MVGFSPTSQELVCDGVPLAAIAAAEGTPVYVYSAALLRQRYRDIVRTEIAQTVSTESELYAEMDHLFAALD